MSNPVKDLLSTKKGRIVFGLIAGLLIVRAIIYIYQSGFVFGQWLYTKTH